MGWDIGTKLEVSQFKPHWVLGTQSCVKTPGNLQVKIRTYTKWWRTRKTWSIRKTLQVKNNPNEKNGIDK